MKGIKHYKTLVFNEPSDSKYIFAHPYPLYLVEKDSTQWLAFSSDTPLLMSNMVTIKSLKRYYDSLDFDNLKLVTLEIKQVK